jgi:hypothetical protein
MTSGVLPRACHVDEKGSRPEVGPLFQAILFATDDMPTMRRELAPFRHNRS